MSDYSETACSDDVPKAAYSRDVEPHISRIKQLEMENAELRAMAEKYRGEAQRLYDRQSSQPVVNIIIGGQQP